MEWDIAAGISQRSAATVRPSLWAVGRRIRWESECSAKSKPPFFYCQVRFASEVAQRPQQSFFSFSPQARVIPSVQSIVADRQYPATMAPTKKKGAKQTKGKAVAAKARPKRKAATKTAAAANTNKKKTTATRSSGSKKPAKSNGGGRKKGGAAASTKARRSVLRRRRPVKSASATAVLPPPSRPPSPRPLQPPPPPI